ncbi:MAG: hypothetical protein ABIR79_12645 [Candidatus Binatia bacterium]
MSIVDVYRYDPGGGAGQESHHGLSRTVAGTTRKANAHALIHDALDWGGSTANVMAGATTTALGTYITCEGFTWVTFKVELSAADIPRRFYAVHKDANGTPRFGVDSAFYEVAGFGPADGITGAATVTSTYFHAGLIRVPVQGAKQCTLWLLDGLSAPTVQVWGAAT